MKESDSWDNPNEYPLPPNPDGDNRMQQEQWAGFGASSDSGYPQGRMPESNGRKRKWIAGLLAFLIPGIGHMYLGLMVKGIVLMMLVALDITAIVYVSIEVENVLSIVLLSLLLPIIYFYNLFDAIQSTETVNDRHTAAAVNGRGWTEQNSKPSVEESFARNVPPVGILFLAGAGIVILVMAGTDWTDWLFNSFGSMFGAVILICAGIGLWFWETKGQQGKGN
ncbi:hypothetical protein [Cohnella luojiensis]|uniref:TM2 domain-containing protein n=1 Tax=Cohnella luojiensis TaxID=652876 RepID=A0A4Y8M055_9BACL|nr:hypothetical protein [Cohnella luojiensis]TFE25749.1 hypothetical protein E2980_12575 [Cohnella luojiensis]